MIESLALRYRPGILLGLLLFGVACAQGGSGNPGPAADSAEAARMKEGLNLLYEKGDPIDAELAFRDVLKANPTHYGARFQLAKTLDLAGKPVEARGLWVEVLAAANAIGDTATSNVAQPRLAQPDTVSQVALMNQGLYVLYTKRDAAGAVEKFRKVLALNPKHYAANYQMAVALGKSGKQGEAKQYWQNVLTMALSVKDTNMADTARAAIARRP